MSASARWGDLFHLRSGVSVVAAEGGLGAMTL